MYIINTIPHGKCYVRYLRTRCFCIRNLTRSLRSLVRFLICQQLVRKYRTSALSMKYSLFKRRYVLALYNRDLKIRRRRRQPGCQKSNRFNNQNNNFARASCFFVHFFAVTARLRREIPNFTL